MKLVFLGPPGAGKGTVAHAVEKAFGIMQISTGELLRAAIKCETELGIHAKYYMDDGNLVPDDLVMALLKQHIDASECKSGYILDGFPRTIHQAEALIEAEIQIDRVVDFSINDALIIHRLSGRRIHRETGRVYNVNPDGHPLPPADLEDDMLVLRKDDRPDAIQTRLKVYHEQTEPLVAFYQKRNLLLQLDGAKPSDVLCEEIRVALGR
jgi:adenylate kinase